MADSGRDADVIASGREPRERAARPAGPAWLLAGLLAVALVAVAAGDQRVAAAARALGNDCSDATPLTDAGEGAGCRGKTLAAGVTSVLD